MGEVTALVPERPKPLHVLRGNIPSELTGRPQWVVWRYERPRDKWTKVPYQPDGVHASSTDSGTWSTFDRAFDAYSGGGWDGVGFALSPDDGIAGIDPDGCTVETAGQFMLPTYTERSPGGEGFRQILFGQKPEGARSKKDAPAPGVKAVEVYDKGRYLTITGQQVPGFPTRVNNCQEELEALCSRLWLPQETGPVVSGKSELEDDEVLALIRASKQAPKFSALYDRGDLSGHNGNPSSADQALCNILRFWTQGDRGQIDRLFRASELYREEKWERASYRETTLDTALSGDYETYTPKPKLIVGEQLPLELEESQLAPKAVGKGLLKAPVLARDRLYGKYLHRGYITLLTGPGGVSKSIFQLTMAVGLALGRDLLDLVPELRTRKVLVLNNEDDDEEITRRLQAIVAYYDLSEEDLELVGANLAYQSGYRKRFQLAATVGEAVTGTGLAREVIDYGADVVMMDPFVSLHDSPENDNPLMDAVIQVFRKVCADGSLALLVPHHSRKGATAETVDDNARGATSAVNGVRSNFGLSRMTKDEAKKFVFPEDDAHLHIRLDDGKQNYGPPAKEATWFRLVEVLIPAIDPDTGELVEEAVGVPKRAYLVEGEGPPEEWTGDDVALQVLLTNGKVPHTFELTESDYQATLCRILSDERGKPISYKTLQKRMQLWPRGKEYAHQYTYRNEEWLYWREPHPDVHQKLVCRLERI